MLYSITASVILFGAGIIGLERRKPDGYAISMIRGPKDRKGGNEGRVVAGVGVGVVVVVVGGGVGVLVVAAVAVVAVVDNVVLVGAYR